MKIFTINELAAIINSHRDMLEVFDLDAPVGTEVSEIIRVDIHPGQDKTVVRLVCKGA
jgi:hypothetical protein